MIYAVGDIHGCLAPLQALVAEIHPTPADEVVFLGDYVDRGPQSKEVVEYLLAFFSARPGPRVRFLLGNHEQMLLDFLAGKDRFLFLYNGGSATIESYGGIAGIPLSHIQFFKQLLPYYETAEYLFVHAGIRPGIPLAEQDPQDLLWIRHEFFGYEGRFPKTIVFGHTPMEEVFMAEDRIGIDTGCVYGGKLTGLLLPSREVVQVENRTERPPHLRRGGPR